MRVTRQHRCPICNRPDWCLFFDTTAICMRVVSPKTHTFKDGSMGYVHSLGTNRPAPLRKPLPEPPKLDVAPLYQEWRKRTHAEQVLQLSARLGVKPFSLLALGAAWSDFYRAWAFPMRDGAGAYTGLRLRFDSGYKSAVQGSKQGLFEPDQPAEERVYVCEGPTSTAAGLSMGLFTVGLPSAGAGLFHLVAYLQRLHIREVIVIADNKVNDNGKGDVGFAAAHRVADMVPVASCVVLLPCKDLREFAQLGGSAEDVDRIVNSSVWTKPK